MEKCKKILFFILQGTVNSAASVSIVLIKLKFFMPFAQSNRIIDDAIQSTRNFLTNHIIQFDKKKLRNCVVVFEVSKKYLPYYIEYLITDYNFEPKLNTLV